ncbi:MAG: hypothetical protein GX896_06855 [Clostridiales bacterium]|nr:hypothetical protein [Clostridiales bacterium]
MSERFEDIFDVLKAQGVETYFPNQKTGECLSPYVVIKFAGGNDYANYSSRVDYYDLLCYVPENKYSELIPFKNQIKEYMKALYPMFVDTGYESPSFLDDRVKGHMMNIQYRNNRKL